MPKKIVAAIALTLSAMASAQVPAVPDLANATPLPGSWTYAALAGASESTFRDSSARPQLWIRCTRASRQVSIARPASAAAPFLLIWASAATRSLPASFDPATGKITAQLTMMDPLLDALAFSRGRIGVSVSGQPALVAPSYEEIARVVEDCRT